MLGERLRRWPNNKYTLGHCLVFAGEADPITTGRISILTPKSAAQHS